MCTRNLADRLSNAPKAPEVLTENGYVTNDSKIIGTGRFGVVYLAVQDGQNRAVKAYRLRTVYQEIKNHLIPSEIDCLKMVDHPNICKMYSAFKYTDIFQFLVFEYCSNGSLRSQLENSGPLEYKKCQNWMKQLLSALVYLHDVHRIAHRDLKPENVLIDEDNNLKLADFGFARVCPDGMSYRRCGSINYKAPELFGVMLQQHDVFKADVYSFGILIFEAITNTLPYEVLIIGPARLINTWPQNTPQNLRRAVRSMLKFDPAQRPAYEDVASLPFFVDNP